MSNNGGQFSKLLRPRQQGAALLLVLLVAFVGGVTLLVVSQDPGALEQKKNKHDQALLERAKRELIAYAGFKNQPGAGNRPGELVCPDKNNDGKLTLADNCGNGTDCCTYRGWLPFDTLGMEDFRDSSGARLWYAISDAYQTYRQEALNSATPGQLELDNREVVAVLIAPGEKLPSQADRPPADADGIVADEWVDAFLEGFNAQGDATDWGDVSMRRYFSRSNNPGSNDLVIAITAEEIWRSAAAWALREAQQALVGYYVDHGSLPFAKNAAGTCNTGVLAGVLPAIAGNLPCGPGNTEPLNVDQWFVDNQWDEVIYYVASGDCAPGPCSPGAGGALALNGQGGDALLASAGAPMAAVQCWGVGSYNQVRPSDNVCDYLDMVENTDNDAVFVSPSGFDRSNDRLLILDF